MIMIMIIIKYIMKLFDDFPEDPGRRTIQGKVKVEGIDRLPAYTGCI